MGTGGVEGELGCAGATGAFVLFVPQPVENATTVTIINADKAAETFLRAVARITFSPSLCST
jgi:hypothetical protein